MIVAHHGFGEELVLYVAAGGAGTGSAVLVLWRFQLTRVARWLRRR